MTNSQKCLSILSILLLFSLGCSFVNDLFEIPNPGETPSGNNGGNRSVSSQPPTIPAAPAAQAAPAGSPSEQAAWFADSLARGDTTNRLAVWMGVYQALGIPVIGQDGVPLGGISDDPIGPRFWQVWYASGLDLPGRGITLTNAGQLLAAGFPGENGISFSQVLIEDLRSATQSSDPLVQLMGYFVRERILRGPSHADVLDLTADPSSDVLDLPTLQLLSWAILRAGLSAGIRQDMATQSINLIGYSLHPNQQPAFQVEAQASCSDVPGAGSDAAYWTQWLVNKIGGGFQLPGMQNAFPSLVERVLGKVFEGKGANAAEKASATGGKVLGYTTAATSAISLILQFEAMTVNPAEDPNPLVRTKSSSYPGNEGTLRLQLFSDPNTIPDGNKLQSCLASFFVNALGVSFTFPSAGPISGAMMSIQGGAGFPDLVMFNINGAEGKGQTMRADTDENGFAYFKVVGAPQKKDVPEIADPVKKEFSVSIKAQPEESGLNSMANMFFNGLSFATSPSLASAMASLVDMLKTFSFDMGEYYFDLQDWITGYVIDFSLGGFHIYGKICDGLDRPFKLDQSMAGQYNSTYSFTPSGSTGGRWDMSGVWEDGLTTISGTGGYTVTKDDQHRVLINIQAGQLTVISKDKYGHEEKISFPSPPSEGMLLFPATTECGQ